jgi:hypothetical protein
MPKMKLGKTAENRNLIITPNCRNCFGHLGKNVENQEYVPFATF